MEKLITCSRVLYDKDISDKMEEITSLKRKLLFYEKPKIEYSNLEEYETKKEEAYQIIKNGLDESIKEDNFYNQYMSYRGLESLQMNMPYYIYEALNLITKGNNKEWIEKISYDIMYGIKGFLVGFMKTDNWEEIYCQLDPEKVSNLIYNNIIWQLDDGTHYPCILGNIAIFEEEEDEDKSNFAKTVLLAQKAGEYATIDTASEEED